MRPRKTILCVEDNEQILSIRKFLLETRGYRVLSAGSAAEALEFLQGALPGSIDLLLSDLILPQMDGNELARRAKQIHACLPVLIVSGTVTSFDRAVLLTRSFPREHALLRSCWIVSAFSSPASAAPRSSRLRCPLHPLLCRPRVK